MDSAEPKTKSASANKHSSKTILVHDWLNGARGGELVFDAIVDLFPEAEVYTLIYQPELLSPSLREKLSKRKVHVSIFGKCKFFQKYYRHLLPFLPLFMLLMRVPREVQQVVSSSHCVAKAIRKPKNAIHVCYIHAPMRYMWARFEDYFSKDQVGFAVRTVAKILRPFLQFWDRATANPDQVHTFIANSQFVAEQVREFYGRDAKVLHPFAELERFTKQPLPTTRGDFYLMVGAFAPNKRIDLAVEAFARMGLPLKIVGSGQVEEKIRDQVVSLNAKNIQLLGALPDAQINALYRECRAFLLPGIEDFGITPLEAMASGAPVICFQGGGAVESVTQNCGIRFSRLTAEALANAVLDLETGKVHFDSNVLRARALEFSRENFQEKFKILSGLRF